MKLIVQGSVIDTEDIWKIDEIYPVDESTKLQFCIHFFNKKDMCITISSNCPNYLPHTVKGFESYEEFVKNNEQSAPYKEALVKFTTVWQQLVDLWSNNQSTIPKLDFK